MCWGCETLVEEFALKIAKIEKLPTESLTCASPTPQQNPKRGILLLSLASTFVAAGVETALWWSTDFLRSKDAALGNAFVLISFAPFIALFWLCGLGTFCAAANTRRAYPWVWSISLGLLLAVALGAIAYIPCVRYFSR